jgi:hypothetical protein
LLEIKTTVSLNSELDLSWRELNLACMTLTY